METLELLRSKYREKTKELYEKKKELEAEIEKTVDANEDEILKARIRVADRKADDALAAGNPKLADKLKKDAVEAREKLQEREDKIRALAIEIKAIEAQLENAGKEVSNTEYPEICETVNQKWIEAISFAENTWADLQKFGWVSSRHKDGFMFYDHGPQKSLFKRLRAWIGTPISW